MELATRKHIIAIPYPLMGHITPLVQICKMLIARIGCMITIVVPERDVPSLLKLLPPDHHHHRHHIHVLPISDGLPLNLAPDWDVFRSVLMARHSPELGLAHSFGLHIPHLGDVACILSDVHLSWTQDVADRLRIPCIALWVAGVPEFQVYTHAEALINSKKLPFEAPKGQETDIDNMMPECSGRPPVYHRIGERYKGEVIDIPGLPSLRRIDFPSFLQIEDPTDIFFYIWIENVKNACEASMVLFNTFDSLDGNLIKLLNFHGIHAASIGPLSLLEDVIQEMEDGKQNGGDELKEHSYKEEPNECLEWLDTQKPRSVHYVAFGTVVHLTKTQVTELAMGLQSSGQPFIWAYRQYTKGEEVEDKFSRSFLDYVMVERKGILVQWAPQKHILKHVAIGAFLSHCGWNSVVEAIGCGVPIIGLPFLSDHTLSCKMLVEEWKIGVRLHRHLASGVAIATDIAMTIQEVLLTEKGEKLRERAQELMVDAHHSVRVGGSSYSTLDALIKLLH